MIADDTPLDLSVLIVSYNTREMTLACIASVLAETQEQQFEVIVVDNASTDGSPDAIAALGGRVRLIRSTDNLGFARANNLAADLARGRFILLLNPDTVVTDRAIDRLVAFAYQRAEAKIWGGRTLFADGRLNPSSCWGRMTPWNLFCRAVGLTGVLPGSSIFNVEGIGGWDREGVRDVDIVSGCFLLLEREFWHELGGFDPVYFMYGEDADLCLRAAANGAAPAVTSAATIVHHGGSSEATREGKMVKLLAAKTTLVRRHWPAPAVPLGVGLIALWPLMRTCFYTVAALVRGQELYGGRAASWAAIWRRRYEWTPGYATPAYVSSLQPLIRPVATSG